MQHSRGFAHDRLRRRLSEYLDGTLDPATEARVAAQLERCDGCADELEALRETVHLLQDLSGAAPPADFADDVMARIQAGEADPGWRDRIVDHLRGFFETGFGAPLATGAAALLVMAVVQDVEIAVRLPGGGPAVEPAPFAATVAAPEPARRVVAEADPRLRGLGGAAAPAQPAGRSLSSRHLDGLTRAVSPDETLRLPGRVAAGMPTMEECLQGRARAADCNRWHPLMIELALREPRAFLAELESVPRPARDRWIGELSRFAGDAGTAPLLAHELRATGDPRASRLAPRFERAALATPR